MILIETWKDADLLKVRASGYADSDRVHCAVYVLTRALAYNAFNVATDIYDFNDDIDITMDNDLDNEALLNSYLTSIKMIANQYPDCITVKED